MSPTRFVYVLVGKDSNKRMILCRESDYNPRTIQQVIKKAFPELFSKWFGWMQKIPVRVEENYEFFSSHFDMKVYGYQEKNDWDEFPFIALSVFKREGETFCRARPVEI